MKQTFATRYHVLIVAVAVFVVETLWALAHHFPAIHLPDILYDAVILTIIVASAVYLFSFLPLKEEMNSRARAEMELRQAHDELDQRVRKRTAELEVSNRKLQAEITERRRTEEALHITQSRYRAVAETEIVGVAVGHKDGSILEANEAYLRIVGYTREDLAAGRIRWTDMTPPEYRHQGNKVREAIDTGEPMAPYEKEYIRKDGTRVPVLIYIAVLDANEGTVTCLVLDQTERKRAQKALDERTHIALLQAEVMLALRRDNDLRSNLQACAVAIADHLDAAIVRLWTLNVDCDILELQASGGVCTSIDGPDSRIAVGCFKAGIVAQTRQRQITNKVSGDPLFQDHELLREQGVVAFAGYPMMVGSNLVGVLGIFARHRLSEPVLHGAELSANAIALGITRRHVEEAHRRLATAVDQAAESIVITDAEGAIVYANPAFEKTTGYSVQEILGQNPRILKSGKQERDIYRQLWTTIKAGDVWRGHLVNRRRNGALYHEEKTISPIRNAANEIVNFVAVGHDVTREIELEAQLRQSQKIDGIGRLAGGVAHDFNNILMAIIGYCQMAMKAAPDNKRLRECLEEIKGAADHGSSLTRQLLTFSRHEVFHPQLLDLNDVLMNIQRILRRLLGEDVKLIVTTSTEPVLIKTDIGQVEQIIVNLSLNARDAMPSGGRLIIKTTCEHVETSPSVDGSKLTPGKYGILSVSDSGSGMTTEVLSHLFEPFFTTKDTGKGTGLGLATVYGIVKQSRGHISVSSELGKGTVFNVYFPVAENLPELKTPLATSKPCGGTETLLLIEDEDRVRRLVHACLESEGYKVLEAANGDEALRLYSAYPSKISLMVTDVIMPGINGADTANRLTQLHPQMKVLFISGYPRQVLDDIKDPKQFLRKPFQTETLLEKVREMLDS